MSKSPLLEKARDMMRAHQLRRTINYCSLKHHLNNTPDSRPRVVALRVKSHMRVNARRGPQLNTPERRNGIEKSGSERNCC